MPETSPYGRCVYDCDNDVVDNQVVNMLFEGGRTVGFTMTAFTEHRNRQTRIFSTRVEITGDGSVLDIYNFLTDTHRTIDTSKGIIKGRHDDGDYEVMRGFVQAVANQDLGELLSGAEETLESHLMVFASERSRRENCVVSLDDI